MDPIVSSPVTGRGVTATFGNLSSPWCKAINVIGTVCVEPSYAKCEPGFQPAGLRTHCGNEITPLLTTYQPLFHHFLDVESHFVPPIRPFLSPPPMEWGSDGEKSWNWLSSVQRWEFMFQGILWRRWHNANSCRRNNLLYGIISKIPYHSFIVRTYIHVRHIDWYLDLPPWGVWWMATTLRAQSLVKVQIRMHMGQWDNNACTSLTNSRGSFSSSSSVCPGTTSSPVTPNRSTQLALVSSASISFFMIASRWSRHVGELVTTESTVSLTSNSTSVLRHYCVSC